MTNKISFMGLANDGGCGNDSGPQKTGGALGWCCSCDRIWEPGSAKINEESSRAECPICGDLLIFADELDEEPDAH